ncbi:MAG: MOSC domain-containing protein [Acidobacteria bacterium]|nr:MOSC domain-containing protein [Acidobacteriota bacterium]
MFKGNVVSIHISPAPGKPMQSVDEAHAVPGKGLEGDRYFAGQGTFWKKEPDRELTLIESEAFDGMRRESQLDLEPHEGRRNIVTRGVPLNHLVGREFQLGEVRVRGLRLCEPCKHLAKISRPGILGGLVHRGGLRAQILTDGLIKVGDEVEEVMSDE